MSDWDERDKTRQLVNDLRAENEKLRGQVSTLKYALESLRIRFVGLFNSYVRKTYHENSNPDNDLELALFDTDAALAIFEQKDKV